MANMPHMKRREGDEWYCPRCGLRWGVDEHEPVGACIDTRGMNNGERGLQAYRR